ncbi:hypothetical protein [Vulcanococcus limneticus]|uniref:hypothetical protein n=1 Tax=Vulcanococcus limneticus TaxID=2170428 RepID=UPI00398C019F
MSTSLVRFIRADWGPAIKAAAHTLATAVVAAYAAGLTVGAWLHRLNDALALVVSRRMAPLRTPAAAPPAAQVEAMSVRELRRLAHAAGHRVLARSGRRAELLLALAA